MLALILDAIIPADPQLGMPSAASIGFDSYITRYGLQDTMTRYTTLVADLAQEKQGQPFTALATQTRLDVITASRAKDIRLFSSVITHVLRAYYSHRDVLGRISSGAVPPFPDGNMLESDDWTLLEPVYERGPIYRHIQTP